MFSGRTCLMGGHAIYETCLMGGHVFRLAYLTRGCDLLEYMSNRGTGHTGVCVL